MAKKKFTDFPALGRDLADNDLILVWATEEEKNAIVAVSDLPASTGGGGGGGGTSIISVASPFIVVNTSPNYIPDAGANTVKILDERLLNKTQYPVATTQFGGGYFRLNVLAYNSVDPDDDTKGSVIISGFQLDNGEQIIITLPGERDASSDTEYAQLKADVAMLKAIAAPFIPTLTGPNGGKVWWPKSAGAIPAGWQECIAMRGRLPIAHDPADIYNAVTNPDGLSRPIGTPGGTKMHTNTLEEMVPHEHDIIIPSRDLANYSNAGPDLTHDGEGDHRTLTTESAGGVDDGSGNKVAKPYSIMNPYLIGIWIEYAGV
ncbi:hypothetical protein ACFS5N_16235 [Mucilaginibacter ximonensis]|uniref:Microcystin-dependent protein n=1 Tax=Mucilaginibacter ximonensis TaxID=538021 RepID=A0ABW5YFC9_9SPHI